MRRRLTKDISQNVEVDQTVSRTKDVGVEVDQSEDVDGRDGGEECRGGEESRCEAHDEELIERSVGEGVWLGSVAWS